MRNTIYDSGGNTCPWIGYDAGRDIFYNNSFLTLGLIQSTCGSDIRGDGALFYYIPS